VQVVVPTGAGISAGVLVAVLAACGTASVPESGVEERTRERLASMHDDVGEVACPEDLEAEVGVTMECRATIDGVVRGVRIEVTGVEDDKAEWKIDVEE
jgi:hypothetical protein